VPSIRPKVSRLEQGHPEALSMGQQHPCACRWWHAGGGSRVIRGIMSFTMHEELTMGQW